jgi:glyoxylase-like metal-dependent hydrolase (beta-lactamase superfamily II)
VELIKGNSTFLHLLSLNRANMKRAILLFLVFVFSLTFNGQTQTPDFYLPSFTKAVSLIVDGMKVLGGEENTKKIKYLNIEYSGQKYMDGQSVSFNKDNVTLPYQNTVIVDFEKDRVLNEVINRYLGGYIFHFRSVYTDSTAFNYEVPQMRFSGVTNLPLTEKNVVKNDVILRNLPNYLLKVALDKKLTLRYLGKREEEGGRFEVVAFPYNQTLTLDLYFDPETKLLKKFEFFTDNYIHGDQRMSYQFSDYKAVNGVLFPYTRVITSNGKLVRKESATIAVNERKGEELFVKPVQYGANIPLPFSTKEIGKNVFLLEGLGGYNPLILNFKDHLVLVEAPAAAQEAIAIAEKKFPGKPIKNVVITHYHEDHAGRLDCFIKRDIPIITTPDNINYIDHLTKAQHSLFPVGIENKKPVVETFVGSKTLQDDSLQVQLLDFGPNSHAQELVVLYFPKEKILYQADLLISSDKGGLVTPLIPINFELYQQIKKHKLKVNTIYGVHWKPVQFADFEKAIKAQRAQAKVNN